jgi:hypothetical protein
MYAVSLFVSFEAPHIIWNAEGCDYAGILGFRKDEILGQSFQIFQGPRTDPILLSSAISNSAQRNHSKSQMELYNIENKCVMMLMTFSPCCDTLGTPFQCKVSIAPSQAVAFDSALSEVPWGKVIFMAESPNNVQLVNIKFAEMIGLEPGSLFGQSLHAISSLYTCSDHLEMLVKAGFDGRGTDDTMLEILHSQIRVTVSCQPVVAPFTGRIGYVVALFCHEPALSAEVSIPTSSAGSWAGEIESEQPSNRTQCPAQSDVDEAAAAIWRRDSLAASAHPTPTSAAAAAAGGGGGGCALDSARTPDRKRANDRLNSYPSPKLARHWPAAPRTPRRPIYAAQPAGGATQLSCSGDAQPASDSVVPARLWTAAGPGRPGAAWQEYSKSVWPQGIEASPPEPQAPGLSKLWATATAAAAAAAAADWQAWCLSESSHGVLERIGPAPPRPPSQQPPPSRASDPDSDAESGWAGLEADWAEAAEEAVTVSWLHREDPDACPDCGNGCGPAARTGDTTGGGGGFAGGCEGLVGGGGGEWGSWANEQGSDAVTGSVTGGSGWA